MNPISTLRRRRLPPGAMRNVLLRGGREVIPGELGQWESKQISHPFTAVANYDAIVTFLQSELGLLPAFGWKAGDANTPSHWLKAANVTSRLSLVGSVASINTPWQDSSGNDITAEEYVGSSRREAASGLTAPLDTDDVVCLIISRITKLTTSNYVFSTFDKTKATRGFAFYSNAAGTPNDITCRFISEGGTVYSRSQDCLGAWAVTLAVLRRSDGAFWHHVNNATVQSLQTLPAGTLGPDSAVGLGDVYDGLAPTDGAIRLVAYYYGAGLATVIAADSYSLVSELMAMCHGICASVGGCASFSRGSGSLASWVDHNGIWRIASPGLPRSGDSLGLRISSSRTNKCYNTINPQVTTGYTATGGTLSAVSDASALATAKLTDFGPNVIQLVNDTGSPQYLTCGAATGGTGVHSLSVFARMSAGSGAELGLRDASSGVFTKQLNVENSYARTIAENVIPGDTDEFWCIHVPDGCTILVISPQLEAGPCVTSPIPNRATGASATRGAEVLTTTYTPSDSRGRVIADIAPLGFSGGDLTADCRILTRAGGASGILLLEDGTGGYEAQDGTNTVTEATAPAADGVFQSVQTKWKGSDLKVKVDSNEASGSYDGALQSSGVMTVAPDQAEVLIKNLEAYE